MIRRTRLCGAALATVAALALSACGGSSSSGHAGTGSSGSPGASSLPVPRGVTLTRQGTRLRLGQAATVAWRPSQKKVGVATIAVTRLDTVPVSAFDAFQLNPATRRSTPYYVHATVRNVGRSNLSNVPVPLYLLERNTLLQSSTFTAQYAPCSSRPLPAHFRPGSKARVCLMYFVPRHGKLDAISFRPTQDFAAITWRGRVGGSKRGTKHEKKH
ncbi:MAG: hypothetical protein J2P22_11655 [Nocardioides sp.]|nr:hypothetical protein [Nocardioides sp.]